MHEPSNDRNKLLATSRKIVDSIRDLCRIHKWRARHETPQQVAHNCPNIDRPLSSDARLQQKLGWTIGQPVCQRVEQWAFGVHE
jgi:hypothetical protein